MKKKWSVVIAVFCMMLGLMLPVAVQAAMTTYSGSNVNGQNYSRYTSPMESFLEACDDGTLMRVQYVSSEESIIAEYYDASYQLLKTTVIPQELPIFGGFYATDENYYLVTGQANSEESAEVEVYRITKYDKNWTRISSAGLYDCNTTIPFDAGSVRMDSWGKYLLIRTSHEMYASDEGYNHQANVTIQVDTEAMEITDSLTSVLNKAYGYASHSFNQFIKIEDGKIVAVDHGDAHPRSVALFLYPTDVSAGSFRTWQVETIDVLDFPGEDGENVTGASIGGFELSDTSYLIAGNSVVQDESNLERTTRNVFLASVDKETQAVTINWLTAYEEGDSTTRTPQLVKISDNRFMVLWSRDDAVYYTQCDGTGKQTGDIYCMEGTALSDCAPIVKDNKVVWYTWKNETVSFYEIGIDNQVNPQAFVVENGVVTTKTFCGDSKHSLKSVSYLAPTCTEDGHIAHWGCEICGAAYADEAGTEKYSSGEAILPAAHAYENQGVTDGVAHLVCSVCGDETDKTVFTGLTVYWSENGRSYSTAVEKHRMIDSVLYSWIITSPAEADDELEILISDENIMSYTETSEGMGYFTMLECGTATVTVRSKWNPLLERSFKFTVECDSPQLENTGVENGYATLVCSNCGTIFKVPVMTSLRVWWNEEDGNGSYWSVFTEEKNVGDILYYYTTCSPTDADSELEILISDTELMSYEQTSASMGYFTMLKPGTVTVTIRPKLNPALAKEYTITILGEETTPVSEIFTDVPAGSWYEASVQYVYDRGIMTGLNETEFGTTGNLTRAQLASILYRISASPEVTYSAVFSDVPDGTWYTKAVLWANSVGVVTGYSSTGTFGPNDNVTREQAAVMMYRYAKYLGCDTSASADLSSFTDADSIAAYAKEAVQWAVGNGIITGKSNGTQVDPQGQANRIECAAIIQRFMEYAGL